MTADTLVGPTDLDPVLRDGFEVHQAALRRGLNVLLLPRQVMMLSRSDDPSAELSFVHGVPSSSTLSAVTFAQDKRMRRAQLVEAGLPVPKGGTFSISNGVDDAKKLIKKIGYPVVIKPAMGDNMIEIHAGLRSEADLDEAIDYLRTYPDERPTYIKAAYALTLLGDPEEVDGRVMVPRGYRFLVEKRVAGQYLRFLVIGEQVRSVIHLPDGGRLDGGRGKDVTAEVHPSLAAVAVAATRAVAGLAVAAVDLVVTDVRRDADGQDVWIAELSERPWLAAQAGISKDLSQESGAQILAHHAAERSVQLPPPSGEVSVQLHIEGLTDADKAVPEILSICRRLGLEGNLDVSDSVEGVADGTLDGPAQVLALATELLLDGQLDGNRAMLVEERQV